ncbi:ABC transporter permease [Luteitalea sp.]|jgi:putative ABC transport system permease protein|uniref:ABC transporter permease n=1 Tax=Luteitalea sp. TaxID=2004800 RepID=UPI0037CBE876
MALHLLKLIWNRKRANFLIVTEILLSFLVLAAVTTVAVHYWRNYQAPLGFSYERIWDIVVRVPRGIDATPEVERERLARFARLMDAVRQAPEVESASHVLMPSFRSWEWNSEVTLPDGTEVSFNGNSAGDELAATLSIPVVHGRWFSREDSGQNWDAVVINAAMARAIFGTEQAAGKMMPRGDTSAPRPDQGPARPQRVVGVLQDYRQFGEYSTPGNYMFERNDIVSASQAPAASAAGTNGQPAAADGKPADARVEAQLPAAIVLRLRPGVDAQFEERLVKNLQSVAPDWGFTMKPVEDVRSEYLRSNYLTPLAIMGMVAGFLLLMVALGLSGVLWQNVTQRIRELGLRRAKGADRARIKLQIFMELALMTGIAIGLGAIILAQLPMFGWLGPVPPGIYAASLVLAAALLFVLTSFCGWYPSLLATRIPPAEALRYE